MQAMTQIKVLQYKGEWAIQRESEGRPAHIAGPFPSREAANEWITFRERENPDWFDRMVGSKWEEQ